MLSAKQRAFLKSQSNDLKDLVFIGKEGLTDNVLKQIKDNLFAHELIKIKVQKGSSEELIDIVNSIQNKLGAEVVSIIGNKIIVYKKTNKDNFKHYL